MKKRFKAMGLALIAALSLFAVGAASAQAAAQVHAEKEPVIFEGSQVVKHIITVNGGTISCKKAEFKGTNTTSTSTLITLAPTYGECVAFGRAATIDTTNCKWGVTIPITFPPTAQAHLTGCDPEDPHILVTTPSLPCTVTIGNQSGVAVINLGNEGTTTTRDILVTFNLSGLKYTETGTGCLGSGVGTQQTNGKYTGTLTLKGYQDTGGVKGAQQGIWVE